MPAQENSMFSDLMAEFKDDLGDTPGQTEDPEQHYSLGIAFREMGLLDEAIGELQKVCSLHESGSGFPQILQAYTWLATCFVEKELPEASLRWYDRALAIAPDEQSRSAIHYDMAVALEAAGERQQALQHFLQVLGTNIDYRDTSDRVRELRAELSR
jgi:tetratricopeptide (TPR) repeat protein